jgi:hypothetical protein
MRYNALSEIDNGKEILVTIFQLDPYLLVEKNNNEFPGFPGFSGL